MRLIISLMLMLWFQTVAAQNNPIFGGGNADGWNTTAAAQGENNIFPGGNGDGFSRTTFSQAGNNIFTGGNADGWSRGDFAQAANNIFSGGNADGWSRADFSQSANNIFSGGNGDGWHRTDFAQAMNNIFNGGNSDGWSQTNFSQVGNNIFFGGFGDGWSSTYRPMGPLPVTLLYFTAKKASASSAIAEWKTSQEMNSSHFDVERSTDAVHFEFIGKVNARGSANTETAYSFVDNNPERGNNYYRLKQVDVNGRSVYTLARLVRFDAKESATMQFYPNPTNGILYIKVDGFAAAQMIITVTSADGRVVDQIRMSSGSNGIASVNMSRYAKGTYFVQVKTPTLTQTERIILQ